MIGPGDGGGHGPGHQPDAVLAGPLGQLGLDGAITDRLGPVQVALTLAKQGEVLRQQGQQRPPGRQRGQLGGDLFPVILPLTARYQLYCG